ncbi:complex I subunit 1/NuoH family protein [Halopelagius longus]|uniref:NADH dehydrogenase subunit H n=1 Tax=Halopelagius longus TaxID=1236180 RepID=A0A1H1ATG0_9EURY|nr:complex I subunit 1 family protein [Halopelagius longus]RDI70510.1 NADH-quinone oxidoreductase subunit H [Halopelagius longus]SDQ42912.1 NADH dehydrogenase subunit H [Halopelagius longus]
MHAPLTVLLPEAVARILFGGDPTLPEQLASALVAAVVVCLVPLTCAAVVIWAKRKVTAAFTDRVAVNRIGPFGLLVIVADIFRLLGKELIIPDGVDRPAYDIGPLLVPLSAFLGFAVVPMGSAFGVRLQLADPETGLVYAFAAASLSTLGLTMCGYASNNKFSLLGGLRAVAANIAYEIPLVVSAASVVLFAGTLRTSGIVAAQQTPLLTLGGLQIPSWYAFVNPFAFVLFLIANLAEVGRNPFDAPEAPTELVAGYQTEYGSVYWVLIYMGEFVHLFLGGALVATVFLGGPAGPVLPGFVWFLVKIWAVFLFTQWARSAVPRLRIDQLIVVGWKGLLVLSFVNLLVTAVVVGLLAS